MKIPCPQCGGEVQLQETTGFPQCPFCKASLALDLTGVRPHMLCRPRHAPTDAAPLLRRWCDAQGLPAPSGIAVPHLVYRPFWRFTLRGRSQLVPAWPALEARWVDVPVPEGEQIIFDAAIVGGARVVEPTIAEVAARTRAAGKMAASTPAGDLVHVPFFEVQARIGSAPFALSIEACSGQVYSESLLPGRSCGGDSGSRTMAIVGFTIMLLEAIMIPPIWPAAAAVIVTAVGFYWSIVESH